MNIGDEYIFNHSGERYVVANTEKAARGNKLVEMQNVDKKESFITTESKVKELFTEA